MNSGSGFRLPFGNGLNVFIDNGNGYRMIGRIDQLDNRIYLGIFGLFELPKVSSFHRCNELIVTKIYIPFPMFGGSGENGGEMLVSG